MNHSKHPGSLAALIDIAIRAAEEFTGGFRSIVSSALQTAAFPVSGNITSYDGSFSVEYETPRGDLPINTVTVCDMHGAGLRTFTLIVDRIHKTITLGITYADAEHPIDPIDRYSKHVIVSFDEIILDGPILPEPITLSPTGRYVEPLYQLTGYNQEVLARNTNLRQDVLARDIRSAQATQREART